MFKRKPLPDGWESLDPVQLKLCRKAAKSRYSRNTHGIAAIENGWPQVVALIAEMPMFSSDVFEILLYAIGKRDEACLRAASGLMEELDEEGKVEVFVKALSVFDEWPAGADILTRHVRGISAILLFSEALQYKNAAVLRALAVKAGPALRTEIFVQCARQAPDCWNALDYFAIEADFDPVQRAQIALALMDSRHGQARILAGDIIRKGGVNLHYKNGALLRRALFYDEAALGEFILSQGFDLKIYGEQLMRGLYDDGASDKMRRLLAGYMDGGAAPAAEGYVLTGTDSVCLTQSLPQGGQLTFAFNFTLGQQVVIAERAGVISQPAVLPFAGMDAGWQAATEAFLRLGGDKSALALQDAGGARLLLSGRK